MIKLKNVLSILFAIVAFQMLAQDSFIRGTVIDGETGEALIGVAVVIDGTTNGSPTDLDGQFQIKADPGTYNLTVSFISFTKVSITDVVVKEGEVTALGTISMNSAAQQLDAVEITAKAVRNTEASMVTMKKKSARLIDGVSAANFKKVGDSDAAAAMSRVTGVTVQGGKYIYVRGLGDRYTKTTLNGIDIPGLDPDRNTVQMDIFPTNIIDNIVVSKSFTADLPADFTGGAVDIELKDFPEEKVIGFSAGLGYNPAMHFNSNFVTYNGGKTDALGFDDGTRAIPTDQRTDIPQYADVVVSPESAEGQDYIQTLQGFDKQMGGYRSTSFMNTSLGLSYANQKATKNNNSIGYSVALSYKNDVEYYEGAEFNLYGKASDKSDNELTPLETQKGDYGVKNVLTGGMAGLAYKTDKSKIKANLLHLQNGESKAGIFDFESNNVGTEFKAKQYNIEYSQRSLTNLLLSGTHRLDADKLWELEWKVAPTRSYIQDPDIRYLRFEYKKNDDGTYSDTFEESITTEVGYPERIWRFLEEYNIGGKADVTRKYKFRGDDAKLKFGYSYNFKNRDFNIQNFQIAPGNSEFKGDPNEIFADENLFSADNNQGVHHNPQFIPFNRNEYSSMVNHSGIYVSTELNATPLLKAIIGLRGEIYTQTYTGSNQTGSIALDNEQVLNDVDLFPTLNLIYKVSEKQNLRFSYSNTIARPSFKEMSYAEILDPITGRTFVGGKYEEKTISGADTTVLWDGNLQSTNITNLDLRWELFQAIGQNISVSAFYKQFKNPIEIVQFLSDPGTFQARNVGDATVIGAEFEVKQSLDIVSERLKNFMFNTNVTVTHSQISLSESELKSRQNSARDGEEVKDTRAMAGQAPYVVNLGLSYNNRETGLQANASYNVQGRTLEFVGFGNRTDVYTNPFNSLNLKVGKAFGEEKNLNVSFKVSNLLNDDKEKVFSSYGAQDQIFSRLTPQRTFSLSVSYTL